MFIFISLSAYPLPQEPAPRYLSLKRGAGGMVLGSVPGSNNEKITLDFGAAS